MRQNFKHFMRRRREREVPDEKPVFVVGVWQNGQVVPADKKNKKTFYVRHVPPSVKLKEGDIVEIQVPRFVRADTAGEFQRRLGNMKDAYAPTLLAMAQAHLPLSFSEEAEKEGRQAVVPPLEKRMDLRLVPFVTIDGADARDFDDAVWAEKTPKGYHIRVAIADVSWYVLPESALDREAQKRGNSTYFPDRVVPMLPFSLSNGVCSLNPHEDRGAMVCDIHLNKKGQKVSHQFYRALIQSQARLTYDEVQDFMVSGEGLDAVKAPLEALIEAYHHLRQLRQKRGVLELEVPERKITLNEQGQVVHVSQRLQTDSMQLIEEMMILANVAAAETLEKAAVPTMYRVHDRPSEEKITRFNDFLKSLGFQKRLPEVSGTAFNDILNRVAGKKLGYALNTFVLRTQAQAQYSPENIGHFGLALARYAHFTSPIRRYADLMVHRALVRAFKLGRGGLTADEEKNFAQIAEHISFTERNSASAEQDAVDKYLAGYMREKIGQLFYGRISSLTAFGVFLTMNDTGADGFVPFRTMRGDYYRLDEKGARLVGRHTGQVYKMGDEVPVILRECDPITGGMIFSFARPKDLDMVCR